ncbi:toxin-antitoxin system YwqK family antitoxin [Variovorax sp. tm]|uniref:toxin-antitoxin system YwqK family antitoxin n=1 Tax=Variovorax atrisoli TaxID=3394203 RepID=UPI003A7FFE71
MDADLNLAEIPYESGAIRFRYTRYMAADGARWIRHGLFVAYHENGAVSSEGSYVHGSENGVWRDFHPNGQLAAEGSYLDGRETGKWRFWSADGAEQLSPPLGV